MPRAARAEEEEIAAFALRLNHGHHWHTHLRRGLLSASKAVQLLVMAAHYYAIVHVAPSMALLAAKGHGRPSIADRQTWLFSPGRGSAGRSHSIEVPFYAPNTYKAMLEKLKREKEEEEEEKQKPQGDEAAAAAGRDKLLSILMSDPATMLFDAAQILMAERQPPGPKKEEEDARQQKQQPKCSASSGRGGEKIRFYKDPRLIMLPQAIGLVVLPMLLVPSLLAPTNAVVPGVPGRRSPPNMLHSCFVFDFIFQVPTAWARWSCRPRAGLC